jgi:hypothetical protein
MRFDLKKAAQHDIADRQFRALKSLENHDYEIQLFEDLCEVLRQHGLKFAAGIDTASIEDGQPLEYIITLTRDLSHQAPALLITLRDMGCEIKSSQRKIEAAHICNSHHFSCSEAPDFTVRVIRDNHSHDEALGEMQSCFDKLCLYDNLEQFVRTSLIPALNRAAADGYTINEKFLSLGEAMSAIGEVPA